MTNTIIKHFIDSVEQTIDVAEHLTYAFTVTGNASPHLTFRLTSPGATATVIGLYTAKKTEEQQIHTTVIHQAPQTTARTVIRGIVSDSAQSQRKGMIEVLETGVSTDSYLSDHSLLLSPKAKSHTTPSLEIQTDEVKCSHGASVAKLSEVELWYLRSRGISKGESRQLLLEGFFRSAINELSKKEQTKILERIWQNS